MFRITYEVSQGYADAEGIEPFGFVLEGYDEEEEDYEDEEELAIFETDNERYAQAYVDALRSEYPEVTYSIVRGTYH